MIWQKRVCSCVAKKLLYKSSPIDGNAIILKLTGPKRYLTWSREITSRLNRYIQKIPADSGTKNDSTTVVLTSKNLDNSARYSSQNGANNVSLVSVIGYISTKSNHAAP